MRKLCWGQLGAGAWGLVKWTFMDDHCEIGLVIFSVDSVETNNQTEFYDSVSFYASHFPFHSISD